MLTYDYENRPVLSDTLTMLTESESVLCLTA